MSKRQSTSPSLKQSSSDRGMDWVYEDRLGVPMALPGSAFAGTCITPLSMRVMVIGWLPVFQLQRSAAWA
ncbi:hypothetical protein METHP14_220053 [Pseudomonas sp. P14-2025]